MGIINCTPDSFYIDSRNNSTLDAVKSADQMIKDGASILDIGGESSRPGSDYISVDEELERVIPVIKSIREKSDILISVDTRKAKVAAAALDAGANIINDISALRDDNKMVDLAAERKVPIVLMHMSGNPKTMQKNPSYREVIYELLSFFKERIRFAVRKGVQRENIIVDPGIGFGKRVEDNLTIIRNLHRFKRLKQPLLMGLSRKSFMGQILGREADERLSASLSANLYSVFQGADILRVHDVQETCDAVNIVKAIEGRFDGLV